jgi:hypothetical protein
MGQLVKYLTVTAAAAALSLPASASASASASAGIGIGSAPAAASPERGAPSPQRGVPELALPFPVRIERTGGFAGVDQSIAISRDGRWRYSDRRGGTVSSGHLRLWQIWALRRVLRDPALPGSLGDHPAPGCADAFQYRVVLARWLRVSTYTDCGNAPRPLARVVNTVATFTAL